MARKTSMTPEVRERLTEYLERIVSGMAEEVCEVDSPIMATVKYEDGTFKKKPLMATQEFFPVYGYAGVSGKLIIGFEPVDAQDWKYIELDPKEVDTAFPLFGASLAKAFDVKGEKFPNVLQAVIDKFDAEREEEARREAEEAKNAYENNELFGMF